MSPPSTLTLLNILVGVENVQVQTMSPKIAPFGPQGRPVICPKPPVTVTVPVTVPVKSGARERGTARPQIKQLSPASSSKMAVVRQGPNAPVAMPVMGAMAQMASKAVRNVKPNWQPVRVLILDFWEAWLPRVVGPEQCNLMLGEISNGVPIGRPPATGIVESPNWPSATQLASQVNEIIFADLMAGKLLGPFITPPFPSYIVSPLGAFLKKDGIKIRLIHDLSYPSAESVNIAISAEEFSLQYSSVEDAVRACNSLDNPILSNIDLKDAYKAIGVAKDDWHLLGLRWSLPGYDGSYYFSKVLSFGLRSAPAQFDKFAAALEFIMGLRGVKGKVIRYVDDFLLVSESPGEASDQLNLMIETARLAGFTIQDTKVTPPCTVIEFLGIVIDLDGGVLRISTNRMDEVKSIIAGAIGSKVLSKRRLLKIIGKLSFAARVVRTGRAFLGRLIGQAKSAKALHHRVTLSAAARADLLWWRDCVESHNGTRLLKVDWSTGIVHHVYTDASGHGCGAVWGDSFFALSYTGSSSFPGGFSINWRELHTAVKALATWGPALAGTKVLFHIDNSVTCHLLNKLYSPIPELMELVRSWCLLVELHSIDTAVVYISTHDNVMADALSRGDFDKFRTAHGGTPSRIWPTPVTYFNELV